MLGDNMPIRAPLIKGKKVFVKRKTEEKKGVRLREHTFYGGPRTLEELLESAQEVEIDEYGQVKMQSYWFCFISSLDRAKDISLLKELLFWATLYHKDDAEVNILVSGYSGEKYDFYRRVFNVVDIPSLVLTDERIFPIDFVKFGPDFFTVGLLGNDFGKLRDVMDSLHNLLSLKGNLKKVRDKIIKKKLSSTLAKGWKELKDLISITVSLTK